MITYKLKYLMRYLDYAVGELLALRMPVSCKQYIVTCMISDGFQAVTKDN